MKSRLKQTLGDEAWFMVRDAPPDEQGDLIHFIGMLSSDVGRAELVKLHGAQLEKQTAGDAVSPIGTAPAGRRCSNACE